MSIQNKKIKPYFWYGKGFGIEKLDLNDKYKHWEAVYAQFFGYKIHGILSSYRVLWLKEERKKILS